MNDLDKALIALGRSKSALPELMRRLGEGDLWFLVPYHPEVEGELIELKNGMLLPFSQLVDEEGPIVPLFSSFERVEEALKKAKIPQRKYSAATMPAKQALEILGRAELRAILNKSCQTGQMIIPANMMRDIADGSALRPISDLQPEETHTVSIIDPADYPTELVQAAFEVLRRHPQFRAAWIFERGKGQPTTGGGRRFQFLVLMEPRDAAISHDFNLVVNSAHDRADEVELGFLDENDSNHLDTLWRAAPAFYAAPDYERRLDPEE